MNGLLNAFEFNLRQEEQARDHRRWVQLRRDNGIVRRGRLFGGKAGTRLVPSPPAPRMPQPPGAPLKKAS